MWLFSASTAQTQEQYYSTNLLSCDSSASIAQTQEQY